jgi:hypothetical protein
MNQRVEMKIGGATVVVTSETIKARVLRDSLYRKSQICVDAVIEDYGVTDEVDILDATHGVLNLCVFSARVQVEKGKLPFELLLPSDKDEELVRKTLAFANMPYDDVYQKLYNLITRIDAPDDAELAPGVTDKYKDFSSDEFDALPEEEKKS